MIELNHCPVCCSPRSHVLGTSRGSIVESPQTIHEAGANALLKHVLAADAYTVATHLCDLCRHVYLSPTFTDDEISRFYSEDVHLATKQQYRDWEQNSGQTWAGIHHAQHVNHATFPSMVTETRASKLREFFCTATRQPDDVITKVCDVGGMTGELARRFENAQRFVFDTNLTHIADGVHALNSREQLRSFGPYDLLIFSHVLEHIPQPTSFLKSFVDDLQQSGWIYVEVPLEYCGTIIKRKGAPLSGHINYFTPSSVRALLIAAGFGQIARLTREAAWYGEQRMVVIKALAQRSRKPALTSAGLRFYTDLLVDCYVTWHTRRTAARDIEALDRAGRAFHTQGAPNT